MNQIIPLVTLCWPVCRGLDIDNDAWIHWWLPINQVALHLADDIFTQLEVWKQVVYRVDFSILEWHQNYSDKPPRWQMNLVQQENPQSEGV